MPEHFNKKPKNLDEQIDLLELRGMIVGVAFSLVWQFTAY
jgi:hypothetical protein